MKFAEHTLEPLLCRVSDAERISALLGVTLHILNKMDSQRQSILFDLY
jgi:hypothetical protein